MYLITKHTLRGIVKSLHNSDSRILLDTIHFESPWAIKPDNGSKNHLWNGCRLVYTSIFFLARRLSEGTPHIFQLPNLSQNWLTDREAFLMVQSADFIDSSPPSLVCVQNNLSSQDVCLKGIFFMARVLSEGTL